MDIWTLCDLVLCNSDCAYCASGNPHQGGARSRGKNRERPWSALRVPLLHVLD